MLFQSEFSYGQILFVSIKPQTGPPLSALTLCHDTAEVTAERPSHSALHLGAGAIATDGQSLLTFDHHYSPSIFDKLSHPAVYMCPKMSSNVKEMSRARTWRRVHLESVPVQMICASYSAYDLPLMAEWTAFLQIFCFIFRRIQQKRESKFKQHEEANKTVTQNKKTIFTHADPLPVTPPL